LGQQQLLLIVLGIIVVGLAIFLGITLFRANAIESKRNNITNDLVNLAAIAQQYYLRPQALGGGNQTFLGWSIPPELKTTGNGSYKEKISVDNVEIIGTGNEVVTGNDSVKVKITVSPANYQTEIIN
jgi:hypothetical protein